MNYKPEIASQYKGSQVILNSGRLLFNAKNDSILLSANKAISLSSAGTLNFDSDKHFIINSPKIYLGLNASREKEPLLLGTQTNELLSNLVSSVKGFTDLIKAGGGTPQSIMASIGYLEGRLKLIESILKNKEILSKSNFTV